MDWRFWRWAEHRSAWIDGILARGWHHWLNTPPPCTCTHVEVLRREWPMIAIWPTRAIPAETNIVGLWWREAHGAALDDAGGIIELDAVPIAGRIEHQISGRGAVPVAASGSNPRARRHRSRGIR
jgi:hypothetical protein